MSNFFVSNIPSVQKRKFGYRDKTSSKDLNDQEREIYADILDLFNKSNKLEKEIVETNMASIIESDCYTKKINSLMSELRDLRNEIENSKTDGTKKKFKYASDAITERTQFDAVIDQGSADIIANVISSVSKVRVYDESYDETMVPDSLKVFIGPDSFKENPSIISIEDGDVNKMFDGSRGTAWIRKVVTDNSVNMIENEIVIGLPEDIITTRAINQIVIRPFPAGYVDIVDVSTKVNGAWTTIPGFNKHNGIVDVYKQDEFNNVELEKVIQDALDLRFNFSDTNTNQIRVKLRQRNFIYDETTNRRTWYLGIKNLEVLHNRYTKNQSVFQMSYDLSSEDGKDIKIYGSEVYFNNGEKDADYYKVTKEFFYYDDNGNTHKISTAAPFVFTGNKIMVRYTIENTQETPNIYKCSIIYKST